MPIRAWMQEHLGNSRIVLPWHNIVRDNPGPPHPVGDTVRQTVYALERLNAPAPAPGVGR